MRTLLKFLYDPVKTAKGPAPLVGTMGAGDFFRLLMPQSNIDYEAALRGKLHLNVLIAMGSDYFANQLAASPVMIEKSTIGREGEITWKRDPGHVLDLLLRNPNQYMTWSVLAHGIGQSWQNDGNIYLLDWPDRLGRTSSLNWLAHDRVTPMDDDGKVQDGSKLITHYRYATPGGTIRDFDPSLILHIRRGIDPNNQRKGFSPVKACLKEVYGDNVAMTYTAALIDNSAVPSLLISPDARAGQPQISDQEQKGMIETMKRLFSREGAGKPGFLGKGVKVEKLAWSPKEMDLGPLSEGLVSRICGAMGFDPMVLGLPSANKTYANREEAEDAAYARVISPAKDQIAEQITTWYLLRKLGEQNTRVAFDNSRISALQDDVTEIAERATKLFTGNVITQAQALEMMGMPFGPENDFYLYQLVSTGTPAEDDPDQEDEPVDAKKMTTAEQIRHALFVDRQRRGGM